MDAKEFEALWHDGAIPRKYPDGVVVTGKEAREIIEFYLSKNPMVDWLPKSHKYYAYGKGGVTVEYSHARDTCLIEILDHQS